MAIKVLYQVYDTWCIPACVYRNVLAKCTVPTQREQSIGIILYVQCRCVFSGSEVEKGREGENWFAVEVFVFLAGGRGLRQYGCLISTSPKSLFRRYMYMYIHVFRLGNFSQTAVFLKFCSSLYKLCSACFHRHTCI